MLIRVFLLLALFGALPSCGAGHRSTLKIGLVAPFEGRYREVGYEVIIAARLAVRKWIAAGGTPVELVAVDDEGEVAQATMRAQMLAVDPQVVAVIGHWRAATTQAAIREYVQASLPVVVTGYAETERLPDQNNQFVFRLYPSSERLVAAIQQVSQTQGVQAQEVTEEGVVVAAEQVQHTVLAANQVWWTGLEAVSGQFTRLAGPAAEGTVLALGAPAAADVAGGGVFATAYRAAGGDIAGPRAVLAYDLTRWVLQAISKAEHRGPGQPSRVMVAEALHQVTFPGLSGTVGVDEHGNWRDPVVYVYRITAGQTPGEVIGIFQQ